MRDARVNKRIPDSDSASLLIHSHILGISPIRNSDDADRNRCFSLIAEVLSQRRRKEERNAKRYRKLHREKHTHRFKHRCTVPAASFIYRIVECKNKIKKDDAGLINDILNTRRGRWRKFSGLLQRAGRAVSCGARRIVEISQYRVHRRADR